MTTALTIAIAAEFELSEKIIEALEQSEINIERVLLAEIYPLEEEQRLRFKSKSVKQIAPDEMEWAGIDYLFFAGEMNHAPVLAKAAEVGCVVIDLKGICATLSDVPVVVPSINEENLSELRQRNIVSLPDPQVSQLALTLYSTIQQTEISQIFVTSLLPTSYTNGETVGKLASQTARLLNGIPLDEDEQRFAFDVFPQNINHLNAQLQKIYPQLENVIFHQIQVPVFYGLAQKVTALSQYEVEISAVETDLIQYHETAITPVINGENESGEEQVKLHLSQPSAVENGIEFWSVADEQRFNIAFLGVKLLNSIYQGGY